MMKFLFIYLIGEAVKSNVFQYDCGLAISLDSLKYVIVTRSMEIKVRLSSNCMNLRDF